MIVLVVSCYTSRDGKSTEKRTGETEILPMCREGQHDEKARGEAKGTRDVSEVVSVTASDGTLQDIM